MSEMKAIARSNQHERHDMMSHQLPEILPRLLKSQSNHNPLLRPIRSLKQIVRFEFPTKSSVREVGVHAGDVEVPDGGARHDGETNGTEETEVEDRVGLLHEAELFGGRGYGEGEGEGAEDKLHDGFAGEG